MAETSSEKDSFKVPSLLPASSEIPNGSSSDKAANPTQPQIKTTKKKSDKPAVNVPLPYKEPEWGGTIPPPTFNFEIIKNGTVVSNLQIRSSLMVFGRLEVCDVVFEHPSVSRYHAVVQYCSGDESHPRGFYLYDLGSTHGTFLNKEAIKPKIYYKLKVGYILKFGGSSRLHIFQGPEEEEEVKKPEAEKTAPEEGVCSWGMVEDAEEEEGDTINPFALSTPNEELYLEDPKKTLRGWFEREGYEVEYQVEEKGYRTFTCNVRLPVDTPTGEFLTVEASVNGKKKEAVIACALEACRTLDRMGLLRQSHHESRQRKRKKWEENDFYDSDEDTFYDRTGEIEKRREMRKRLVKKAEVDNFQTIDTKLKNLVSEIEEISAKLDACAAKTKQSGEAAGEDSLETFMSSLVDAANAPTDKFERRKLKLRLIEAEKERSHLEKLLDITRPAKLPPVAKHPGMIGKRPKSKLSVPVVKTNKPLKSDEVEGEEIEEVESETEEMEIKEESSACSEKITDKTTSEGSNKFKQYGLQLNVKNIIREEEVRIVPEIITDKSELADNDSETKMDTPSVSKSGEDAPVEKMDVEEKEDLPVKRSKTMKPKRKGKMVDVYKSETAEYTTWTPPANQSGDGITHLNAKYGY